MSLINALHDTTQKCIIAVDGTSGSGKGTISAALAKRFHLIHSQSSIFYRYLALQVHKNHIEQSAECIISLSSNLQSNEIVDSAALYDENITELTSVIAAIPEVRANLYHLQRDFLESHSRVVMDGRDIGTTIAPDADIKIYVTADIKTRAQRRCAQLVSKGHKSTIDDVLSKLIERDARDQGRAASPLVKADDAIEIDNTNYSVDEVLDILLEKIAQHA